MATRKKETKLTFEEGMAQLEALVGQLEQGEMTLDESLKAYESGMDMYRRLDQMLKEGEARMEMINAQKESSEGVQATVFEVES